MQSDEYTRIAQVEDDHWWYRHTRAVIGDLLAPWLRPGLRVLDAGCGPGGNSAFLADYGTVVGTDLSPHAMRYVKERRPATRPVQGSITDLPFAAGTFDVVAVVTVLYMVPDDGRAVAEVARVLTPGGVAVFVEPAFDALRRDHDVVVGALRRYRRPGLVALAESARLHVERATYLHSYLVPPAATLAAVERIRRAPEKAQSDLERGGALNAVFERLTSVERRLLARRDLPAGVSVVAVATKEDGAAPR